MAIMEIENYAGNEGETYIIRRMARRRQSMEKMTTMSVRRSSILARKTGLTLGSSIITSSWRLSITPSITVVICNEYSTPLTNCPIYSITLIKCPYNC